MNFHIYRYCYCLLYFFISFFVFFGFPGWLQNHLQAQAQEIPAKEVLETLGTSEIKEKTLFQKMMDHLNAGEIEEAQAFYMGHPISVSETSRSSASQSLTESEKTVLLEKLTNQIAGPFYLAKDVEEKSKVVKGFQANLNFLAYLIGEEGFNPNIQAENGMTALMFAVFSRQREIIDMMMKNEKIDPYLETNWETTLAMIAAEADDNVTLKRLLEKYDFKRLKGTRENHLYNFIYSNPEILKLVAKNPLFNPNEILNSDGDTMAHMMIWFGFSKLVPIIHTPQSDYSIKSSDGKTAIQLAKDKKVYRQLRSLIDPVEYAKVVKSVDEKLLKLADLPLQTFECGGSEDILSHLETIPDEVQVKAITCPICISEIAEGQNYYRTKSCDCTYCPGCAKKLVTSTLREKGGDLAKCPIHQTLIPTSFLRLNKVSEKELNLYKSRIMMKKLSGVENFYACPTEGCYNGLVLGKNQEKWLECDLCGNESLHSSLKIKDPMPDPRFDVRPCPFCYKLYNKDDHCNHVTCQDVKCGMKFNFQSGKKDPTGDDWDLYDRGPRTYRVPGDINQKTGEVYKEYVEGVKPEDDLL